jgi:hypothetical protein
MGVWTLWLLFIRIFRLQTLFVWCCCIVGTVVLGMLAWFDVGFFKNMDQYWEEWVRNTGGIVFANFQKQSNLSFYLGCYGVLFIALRVGDPILKRYYSFGCALSAMPYALFWFCSIFAPSALIMQLQLWRANWLALIFALIALVDLSRAALRNGTPERLILIMLFVLGVFFKWIAVFFIFLYGCFPKQSVRFAHLLLERYPKRFWQGMKVFVGVLIFLWAGNVLITANIIGQLSAIMGSSDTKLLLNITDNYFDISVRDVFLGVWFTGGGGILPIVSWHLLRTRSFIIVPLILIVCAPYVARNWADVAFSRKNQMDYQNYATFKK